MPDPISLKCDECGATAEIAMNSHEDAAGKRIEWPKASMKSDGLYFAINCPNCGEREQFLTKPSG
jgi:DNA-directed RNA polymerase subunit RPC12/RpoP